MPIRLTERLHALTRLLLFSPELPASLRPEVLELSAVLADTRENKVRQTQDLASGETRTRNGLALSPTMASMCVDDFVRTIQFLRGTYAAIADLRQQIDHRAVRVLYAGCGPHATLALPLMTVFSSNEAVFTLLDIHTESIRSAKSNVERFGLVDSVASYEKGDAASFCISPDEPPDIILMEMMQACLESEPQVATTRHLLGQAPHAILIPEEVCVNLVLVDLSREFTTARLETNQREVQRDRIPVAPVFVLNREVVNSWDHSCGDRITPSAVCMPESWGQQYQPMLFTDIRVYKNHVLKDYDSGLTCPRAPHIEGTIAPDATIDFVYELGEHPRLVGSIRKNAVTMNST